MSHQTVVPLYVGQARSLRSRIRTQLNNVRLMLGIANNPGRRRVLFVGELIGRPGQELKRTLDLAERTLIEYATLEGYELLNQQGTKPKMDTLAFSGSRIARSWHPRTLSVARARRRK